MSDDDSDRKKRLATLIRDNIKPAERAAPQISIDGGRNVIAMRDVNIVVQSPPNCEVVGGKAKVQKTTWRAELETEILRRVWDLSMTPDQFFELMSEKLGKHFVSMKDLGKRDLDAAYEIIAAMRRPALD